MARGGKREGAGRPKGSRNKLTADIKAVAQSFGEEGIMHLVEIARNGDAPPAARVAAVKEILDRGYGKAKQPLEHTGEDGEPIKAITEIRIVGVSPDGNPLT
ncbi:TPA: hypothetical protein P7236_006391 [Pseudomonas aeruginosa]|uniref:Uncharacterized protein n=2 Tax=Pseudomonas aeruginosa TaxID=287 RepID=A0A241XTG8_PSEAI|nr:hypothetical protein [Pseudomonas aeruginosa]AMA38832.1 hypothetical protein DPADHS01_23035 [Pseudomonas aeruginosa DHS01]AWE85953.1 hypothetical protein CSC29_4085 [Pseudomonas aeruginosa]EJC9817158.1 hypothetical protein [Pseudomonas aeruginosa]EKW3263902.1 hypothetical protein [Pseudomonas aeruginosa]ELB4562716.1 hypothetical protein [Pseudomonas aeruginosa]